MLERPSEDGTSIEKMVSQKSASKIWVSPYPLQAKGWTRARGAGFRGHADSSDTASQAGVVEGT